MCMRTTCETCGKATYAGCGRHVEQVLGNVPSHERCRCRDEKNEPEKKATSFFERFLR